MESDARLQALLDTHEIENVIRRYCRGIDRMDRALVRGCYHPGATDDHGSFQGDVEAFLAWVFPLLEKYTNTMHFIGNILVDPGARPDLAAAETYGIAFHRSERETPALNLMTGFRYLDRFEQREGQWRIASRVAVTEWSRVDDTAGRWPVPESLLQGKRDPTDALFALLAEIGVAGD